MVERIGEGDNDQIRVQFEAAGLPKLDGLFGKADPFYEIMWVPITSMHLLHDGHPLAAHMHLHSHPHPHSHSHSLTPALAIAITPALALAHSHLSPRLGHR